jgi:hypothetical protein
VLVIIHSGQTGVERGAHRAAEVLGLPVAGFMPLDRRDEFGRLPPDIAATLTPCFERGPRPAVRANVALASGVLIVVPSAANAEGFTAITPVLQAVRAAQAPSLVCDGRSSCDDVARWVRGLPETVGSTRLMVTGPRATRWRDGESIARRFITAIRMPD